MPMHSFYLKHYLIMGWHGQEERKGKPSTLGYPAIGLYFAVRAPYEI